MSAHVTAPPAAGSDQVRSTGRSRLHRVFLGRETAPRWARPALWGVLLLSVGVYVYGLGQNGDANSYYAAAVLSGTKSWSSMFFGSLDTGNFITVDKPPFALWVMEASCRIFGFGTWQMLLPIAACGIAAVGVLYSAVRRVFGHAAATVAGLVLALTPITVAITRDNNPDPVLVLLTVSAAWCTLESIRSGKLQPLVWAGVLVGFAFNTKMLQAYMVLPAFFLAYAWAARGTVLKRVRNLLIAGAALIVSSGWWMVIVDSIPRSERPFVGSSTKDTVWDLVTGYNGLARITGNSGGAGGGGGGANFGGTAGAARLFNSILGGQISWLIPFAFIALAAALVLRGRRRRTDLQRASYLLWGGWLLTHYVTFSFASGTFHPYYTTMLAPAIAALTGGGGVAVFRAFRVRSAAWAWVLPLGIAVSAVWAIVLLRRTSSFDSWLWPTIAVLALAAVVFLLVARFGKVAGPLFTVGAAAGLIALLAGPAAYAADTATGGAINGTNPSSGPSSGGMGGMGGGAPGGGGFGGGTGGGQRGERPTGTTGGFPGGGRTGEMPTGGQGAPGGQTGQTGQSGQSGQSGRTGELPTGGFPGGDGGAPSGGGTAGGFGGGGGGGMGGSVST
ncbi:glycosyltransferase family 39 protein, partial [Streptacidiphilus carbonis]|uniref:glycosyltransferase family 39 protein n=1 Tax=Streptacidiphilus carbonis TaxID=105422 RepID=UPI000693DE6B